MHITSQEEQDQIDEMYDREAHYNHLKEIRSMVRNIFEDCYNRDKRNSIEKALLIGRALKGR